MKKHLTSGLTFFMGLGLFIFVAFFNVRFFMGLMPAGYELLGWLGLFSLDGGFVVWLLMFKRIEQGNAQRTIALVMFIVDLIGSIGSMIAEMIHTAATRGGAGDIGPDARWVLLVVVGVIVGVNIAAELAYSLFDPNLFAKVKEAQLEDTIRERRDAERFKVAETLGEKWAAEENAAWIAKMQHAVDSRNLAVYSSLQHPQIERVSDENSIGARFERLFDRGRKAIAGSDEPTQLEMAAANAGVASAPIGAAGAATTLNADAPTQARITEAQSPK